MDAAGAFAQKTPLPLFDAAFHHSCHGLVKKHEKSGAYSKKTFPARNQKNPLAFPRMM